MNTCIEVDLTLRGSDLLDGANRDMLAEFIVARALDLDSVAHIGRGLPYDNIEVEATSAAYIHQLGEPEQSPSFVLHPERRGVGVHIFCLLDVQDRDALDPVDLNQWTFYVLSSSNIGRAFDGQRYVGAEMIKPIAVQTDYHGIKRAVDLVASTQHTIKGGN